MRGLPFDLALIPCSASKAQTGHAVTAASLYTGSPFQLMLRHAQTRAPRIIIMSAKYGLLELDQRISYYDRYIKDLSSRQRMELEADIAQQWRCKFPQGIRAERVLSYLPRAYHDVLGNAIGPELTAKMMRPWHSTRLLTMMAQLSRDLQPRPPRERLDDDAA